MVKIILFLFTAIFLNSCFYTPQPTQTRNICDIFQQYPDWYWDAKKTQDKWGVPIPIQMAIIYEESGFEATAEPPPRRHFLKSNIAWGPRESTALGYCQALNGIWKCYEENSHRQVSRDQFADASDFIGWYANLAKQMAHIQPTDAFNLYLAYHDGIGAFHNKAVWKHPVVMDIARKVQSHALIYAQQLKQCENQIPKPVLETSMR